MPSALFTNHPYARKTITHEDYEYIYISPHLDDVALSCSGTICRQKAQGQRILIVTLLAGDPQPPFSPLALACHQLWQIPEGVSPYHVRKTEDEQAMLALGVDYLWLNWLDALYRIPDLPDFSASNAGPADCQRDPLFPTLQQWFTDLHAAYPRALIVIPLGVGGHRDHRLVFHAALSALDRPLLFFEDFPYAAYLPEEPAELANAYQLTPLDVDISDFLPQRIQSARFYQSQHAMLFHPPSSFGDLIKDYTQKGEQPRFIERYWKAAQ